jgi:hypothetical protein
VVAAILVCGVPCAAFAGAPELLSYQGYLTDAVGNPVTGEWTISFSFFKTDTGGAPFFEETRDVSSQMGLFNVLLGDEAGNPLDPADLEDGEAFLELSVETDLGPVVLKPRQRVVSDPYALFAASSSQCLEADNAMSLGGKAADTYVTLQQVPDVCVVPEELEQLILALGFVKGPHYSDQDVAAYLAAMGYEPCACYADANVQAFLDANGYAPGTGFSGFYDDLVGAPDKTKLLTKDNAIQFLATSGAVLMADGSVSLAGNLNFASFEAQNLAIHNAAQAPKSPKTGQLWWDTGVKKLKVYDGQAWALIGSGIAADVDCPECVDAADVAFTFAAANAKGGSAIGLACTSCVDATEVSFAWAKGDVPGGDALRAKGADLADNLNCAACVSAAELAADALDAKVTKYTDTVTKLGASTVQTAIEKLAAQGTGSVVEGNGTIIPYVEQWGLPAYGTASTYIHLMNPTTPKVVAHVYAEEASGFSSSNNLVVAYDFAPNQYSGGAIGNAGEKALQVQEPAVFNAGSHILIHQTTGGAGATAGKWEINQVLTVNGSTLQLLKPLVNSYVSNATARAQAVLAASFGQLEVVNGGKVKPSMSLAADGSKGGIVYIRANKITVKTGGVISADAAGFPASAGPRIVPGSSECGPGQQGGSGANCSGGGPGKFMCANAGGGGNKTAGTAGKVTGNCAAAAAGGVKKGSADLSTLEFGGAGGTEYYLGGNGGGIVVLGASTIVVQEGGKISSAGASATGNGSGGGAGGTVAVFADIYQPAGDVLAPGGSGPAGDMYKYVTPTALGAINMDTCSHGGGYSPKYLEFWYPCWSGSTVRRYNASYQYLGDFSSGSGEIMQLWGNADGTYYTANWGQNVIRKWSDMGSNQLWSQGLGSTAGAVCSDGTTVFAMRSSGTTVWKFGPNGNGQGTFDLSVSPSLNGGLACTPGRLYVGDNGGTVRIHDATNGTLLGSFTVETGIANSSFDGEIYYVSNNSSTVYRHRLLEGNMYETSGDGGDGGEGWVASLKPVQGIINESYPKGVEIWVDGANVTATLGDPNGKGEPQWDATAKKWGKDGLNAWSTGPLDLSTSLPWTLGEHKIQFKETGGAGGDLKMFLYVIYPFTKSTVPANDSCTAPNQIDLTKPVTLSGTTEDVMGKIKATDDNQGPFCGGSGGPDVVYSFTLSQWRTLTIDVQAAFTPRVYVKKGKCADGEVVACGTTHIDTGSLEPGTYYLFVDGDGNLQKGDFILKVSAAPPGPPPNDSCAAPQVLTFQNKVAQASGMTLFSKDDHQAVCGGTGAPENVYSFAVPPGTTSLSIDLTADFAPTIYLAKDSCTASPIACIPAASYQMGWPGQGAYYLFVDGKQGGDAGLYTLKVALQ